LEKNTGPPLFFDLISSPFLVCFEWSKNLWVCN
jgi:hypothetical protein